MVPRRRTLTAALLLLAASAASAAAQGIEIGDETVPAFAQAVAELGTQGGAPADAFAPLDAVGQSDGTVLINGEIVDPKFFPAIFRKTSGSNCTSALVGPATILTAAHCVDHGERIALRANGKRADGICEQAPGYRRGVKSEDWALCVLEHPVRGIPYENVDLARAPATGTVLFLTGYGCTATAAPSSPTTCQTSFRQGDRTLRIGTTGVVRRPAIFAGRENTIFGDSPIGDGGAILCPGDSGGPAFIVPNGSPTAVRRLVGVNSATCVLEDRGYSMIAATSSAPGAAFLRDWVQRRNQIVCGVNGSALSNCAF